MLDGKLWLGRGSAGELGHVVIKLGGRRCPCGRRGCVEAYAGRAAMERTARKAEEAGTTTKLFTIMKKRGRNLVDVDAMVVGGGLGTRLGQPFVLTERCDNGGALGAALLASA